MLTKVTINSVDVTSYLINYEIEHVFGDAIAQVDLNFVRGINSVVTLTSGQTLEIWRGWVTSTDEKIFSGYVEKFEPEGGKVKVIGLDKMWDLVRKEVTHVYNSTDGFAGKLSAIFTDLVTTYGGLTADGTSVQDSGTTVISTQFKCNHVDPFDRCKKLADILTWQMYYRADTDKVYFESQGYSTNTNVLTVGSNVIGVPKWNYDITEMINDLTLIGSYQLVVKTELFTGDGSTKTFTIAFVPSDLHVYYNQATNFSTTAPSQQYEKVGGLVDSTGTYDYTIDALNKQITFSSAPAAGANNVAVIYTYPVPTPVHMSNAASILAYGQFRKTITYTDIKNVSDAEARATNYLTKYSTPFTYSTLKVKSLSTLGLAVGQKIRVVDNVSTPHVDLTLLINRHRIRYPADYDEIDVGDKYWRLADWQSKIEEKIKRMNEEEFENQDIILEIIEAPESFYLRRETMATKSRTLSGTNIFILESLDYGILDTNKLDDTTGILMDISFVKNRNKTFTETFYSDDWKDTAITTCTWDTSAHQATFTNGQILQTQSLAKDGTTWASVTITTTESGVGSLALQATADGGSHWENITSGVNHNFTDTGTDIRFKATATGNKNMTKFVMVSA